MQFFAPSFTAYYILHELAEQSWWRQISDMKLALYHIKQGLFYILLIVFYH